MTAVKEKVKKALIDLVGRKDATVFQDPKKFAQAMIQICGQNFAEVNALTEGLLARIPWELRKNSDGKVSKSEIQQLSGSLQNKRNLQPDLAFWAVITWAEALGLSTVDSKSSPEFSNTKVSATEPQQSSPTIEAPIGIEFSFDDRGLVQVSQAWGQKENPAGSPQALAGWVKPFEKSDSQFNFVSTEGSIGASNETLASEAPSQEKVNAGVPIPPNSTVVPGKKTATNTPEGRTLGPLPIPPTPKNAQEQYNLALDHLKGKVGRTNVSEALKLLKLASNQNFLPAIYKIGEIHLKGLTGREDIQEAVKWFQMAAEKGYGEAQVQLGSLYQIGIGVEMSVEKAVKWLKKAVEQGNAEAKDLLAQINQPGEE